MGVGIVYGTCQVLPILHTSPLIVITTIGIYTVLNKMLELEKTIREGRATQPASNSV